MDAYGCIWVHMAAYGCICVPVRAVRAVRAVHAVRAVLCPRIHEAVMRGV